MTGPFERLAQKMAGGADSARAGSRARCGRLSGAVGVALNLLLSAAKFLAGWLTGSLAMTADALNNLTDAGSSVVTLVGFQVAGHEADREHPFGHGRAEYVSGLIVSLVIMLVGVELAKSSAEKIIAPQAVSFSPAAVAVLAGAILVKLGMWRFNAALGKAIGSPALEAAALDALSDGAATGAVLAGTLLGRFAHLTLDGWLGLGVALFILWSGFRAVRDTLDPLLGRPASEELAEKITALVLAEPEILGIHELLVHEYGPGHLFATIHAEVNADMSLLDAHAAADRAEQRLLEELGVQAVIHVDPLEARG